MKNEHTPAPEILLDSMNALIEAIDKGEPLNVTQYPGAREHFKQIVAQRDQLLTACRAGLNLLSACRQLLNPEAAETDIEHEMEAAIKAAEL